jgi:PD-(D/E)XK endonuclease
MDRFPKSEAAWSDAQLKDAVAAATNWRDVMRALGLRDNSAGAIRIMKRHVGRLGLDTSHFRGKRSWSDAQLRRAVIDAQSWDELLTRLGLAPRSGDGRIRVKAHSMRLGLDLAHLENPVGTSTEPAEVKPDLRYLRDAATSLAASWFSLCGFNVAIPLEPTLYDLLVSTPEGIKRVQVKTTTCFSKDGWTVAVGRRPYSIGNRERRLPYDPESIDWFFIVDGDLTIYLIPSRVIAGRVGILLHTYTKYIVGSAAGFMTPRPRAAC